MTVNKPLVKLYERDGFELPTDELLYGWNVRPLSVTDKYAYIGTPMNYSGYAYIKDFTGKTYEADSIVTAACTGAYAKPTFKDSELFVLFMGSRLKLTGNTDGIFSEVEGVDGERFFVHTGSIERIKEEFDAAKLVKTAKKLLGAPYKWGGKTVLGIDCSGFVAMCYYMCGIEIYRDSDPDKTPCFIKVGLSELMPGDAVYLKGHVGMYAGGGRIVHASWTQGRVVHSSVEEFISSGDFVCACRYANRQEYTYNA